MSEIEEMVEEAKMPGKFNIVDAVRGRAYPKNKVDVFIDEEVAYQVAELNELIDKIGQEMDKKNVDKKHMDKLLNERDKIMSDREKIIEDMGGTKYVFHLTGISEGNRQDIYDKALKQYPIKYEKSRSPLTGMVEKEELEDAERDRYFTTLLWQSHITKIIAPDGSEQEGITYEDALELRRILPLAAITTITEAIERMRAATAIFMMSVNEDFLAKS